MHIRLWYTHSFVRTVSQKTPQATRRLQRPAAVGPASSWSPVTPPLAHSHSHPERCREMQANRTEQALCGNSVTNYQLCTAPAAPLRASLHKSHIFRLPSAFALGWGEGGIGAGAAAAAAGAVSRMAAASDGWQSKRAGSSQGRRRCRPWRSGAAPNCAMGSCTRPCLAPASRPSPLLCGVRYGSPRPPLRGRVHRPS